MPDSGPKTAGRPLGCVSDETLAAHIDGMLSPREAAGVVGHLADCEDCYAIYAGVQRFRLDMPQDPDIKEGEGKTNVVPFPSGEATPRKPQIDRRGSWSSWYKIAALLAVGVGAGSLFVYQGVTPPTLETAKMAEQVPNEPGVFDTREGLWTGPVYRGGSGEPEGRVEESPFRTGVQLVNLQVSLQAGKKVEAQNAIAALLGILEGEILSQDLQKQYGALTAALDGSGRPPASFLPEAQKLAAETRSVFVDEDELSLDLGQWVEAGRMAAAAQSPAFFNDGKSRSFLRSLLWRETLPGLKGTLSAKTRTNLQAVSDLLGKSELTPDDYRQLSSKLGQILDEHYPMSGG